jgi:hypothetical protein
MYMAEPTIYSLFNASINGGAQAMTEESFGKLIATSVSPGRRKASALSHPCREAAVTNHVVRTVHCQRHRLATMPLLMVKSI